MILQRGNTPIVHPPSCHVLDVLGILNSFLHNRMHMNSIRDIDTSMKLSSLLPMESHATMLIGPDLHMLKSRSRGSTGA
jgi:hypothetical protein